MNELFCSMSSKFYSCIYEPGVQEGFRMRPINLKLICRQMISKSLRLEEISQRKVSLVNRRNSIGVCLTLMLRVS